MTASESNSEILTLPQKKRSRPRKTRASPTIVSDESTKLLALAEEVAHFGSWEFDTSKPRAIWSPELFRIFGIEPKAQGLTWEEYTSFIHPDDLPMAKKNMEIMLNAGLNHREVFDYRIIRPDGSVRTIHSQRQVREVTPEGKTRIIVGVDQDLTEQKQAEEALKRSEERFRAVAEAANILVYENDLINGKVRIIRGDKELVGYEHQKGDHTIAWSLSRMHPDDVPHVIAVWNKAKNDPKIECYSMEYRLRHKTGGYIIVKDTAKAIKDRSGKTVQFIGGVRDITQRRRDQEKIKEYSKHLEKLVEERTKQLVAYERLATIGQLAGMVGHDIRNPLQALTGEVYLIKTEIADMPENQAKQNINESLDSIEQGIGYINKIVADLQDYSRQLNPEYQMVNLQDLIADMLKTIVIPQQIMVSITMEALPKMRIDPTFTRRALTNLINNAIQAMPQGGQLTIGGYRKKSSIYITVTDTGVGIPDEVKDKLFKPMFTTKAKGQGFGLAVVKRLIEAQGGSINLESIVGKGTKFTIRLPI